jgi:hypothetical protein
MKKRILSLVLVVALLFSMASVSLVSASAAADTTLYFEMPQHWIDQYGTTPGEKTTSVFCYVFTVGGSDPDFATPSWQSKSTKATYDAATGLYSFDVEGKYKQTLKDGADYCVIFSAKSTVTNANPQCYDLTFGTQCYGDTVYVTEKIYENPADSQKTANAAYWRNEENAAIYGPHAGITSMGVLQGEVYAPGEDKVAAVANFIASYPDNIITNPDPNVCVTLCDSVGVTPYEVYVKYEANYNETLENNPEAAALLPALEQVAAWLSLSYPPVEPTEPTTAEPTTEPTTAEPTTEPTTAEPTTEEPTTEEPTVAPADKFTVAGDCMTPAWDPSSNEMTKGEYEFDGVAYDYAITVDVEEGTWNFKVTNGTWDVAYPANNFSFTVTDFGAVTIYFDSATQAIAVDGEYIDNSEFVVETITAVGNGDGTWLNGANWDPSDVTNDLTEIAPGVWEITYTDIDAYDSYEVKFAVNHSWTYNWTIDGIFDGQTNIGQVVEQDGSTVTLRIDINGFDFKTKEGTVVTAFEVTPPTVDEPVLGDVDGDGILSIKDATLIQTFVTKLCTEADLDLSVADVNGDGYVSIVDATYVQLMVAGYTIA